MHARGCVQLPEQAFLGRVAAWERAHIYQHFPKLTIHSKRHNTGRHRQRLALPSWMNVLFRYFLEVRTTIPSDSSDNLGTQPSTQLQVDNDMASFDTPTSAGLVCTSDGGLNWYSAYTTVNTPYYICLPAPIDVYYNAYK
jgi:hypothetical protein